MQRQMEVKRLKILFKMRSSLSHSMRFDSTHNFKVKIRPNENFVVFMFVGEREGSVERSTQACSISKRWPELSDDELWMRLFIFASAAKSITKIKVYLTTKPKEKRVWEKVWQHRVGWLRFMLSGMGQVLRNAFKMDFCVMLGSFKNPN